MPRALGKQQGFGSFCPPRHAKYEPSFNQKRRPLLFYITHIGMLTLAFVLVQGKLCVCVCVSPPLFPSLHLSYTVNCTAASYVFRLSHRFVFIRLCVSPWKFGGVALNLE